MKECVHESKKGHNSRTEKGVKSYIKLVLHFMVSDHVCKLQMMWLKVA